jgi:hypothetical protein
VGPLVAMYALTSGSSRTSFTYHPNLCFTVSSRKVPAFPQYRPVNEWAKKQIVNIERRIHSGCTEPFFYLITQASGTQRSLAHGSLVGPARFESTTSGTHLDAFRSPESAA